MRLSALLLVAVVSMTSASPYRKFRNDKFEEHSPTSNEEPAFFRLPRTTVPEEYDIRMIIDPAQDSYIGDVAIFIRVMEETDTITLHAFNLRYTSVFLLDETGTELSITNTTSRDDRHFLYITLNDNMTLTANARYELIVNYWARFPVTNDGLFRSSYTDYNGDTKYLAATQFQATYARYAFPCYDEPSFKAQFDIHIYHPAEYQAISNTDVITSTLPEMPNMTLTSFRRTPKMSTYLVAMIVSDFPYKSNTIEGPIIYPREYRIYARPAALQYLDYALDYGQRSITFMQAYVDVDNKMPKMDNVALPQLNAGAMENWGLITYIENYLFYEKGKTSALDELFLATIMTHENAHIWFGNEVTPAWWDYLWMNEGFAVFFENYATDIVQNGAWRAMDEFVVGTLQNVMVQDSEPSQHAMNNVLGAPDDISRSFDAITYFKSASVVRMIEHMVGEQLFRLALSSYIKSLPTGVTTPEILYREMEKIIGNSVQITDNGTFSDVFRSWADQAGYPIVYMTSITGSTTVVVSQEQYYFDSSIRGNGTWWIPFTWTSSSNLSFATNKPTVISPQTKEYYISVNENSWYIANLQQSGYYRVMYDQRNWQRLILALSENNHTRIHPLNKAQLLDDSFAFSITNRLTYNITLGIVNYLQKEKDYIPWISAARGLNTIKYLMPASNEYELYKQFIRKMVTAVYNSVDFDVQENDLHVTKRTRSVAFEIACEYELSDCWTNAQRILSNEANNSTMMVNADLALVGYCYGLKNSSRDLWDYVFSKFVAASSNQELFTYLSYLACTNDIDTIDAFLGMTIANDSVINIVYREWVVRFVASYGGSVGIERTLAFLTDNLVELRDNVASAFSINRIIQTLGSVIVSPQQIAAFDEFVDRNKDEFNAFEEVAVELALTSIEESQNWISKNMRDIEAWLLSNS